MAPLLFLLLISISISSSSSQTLIESVTTKVDVTGYCNSWRLAVENGNLVNWGETPEICVDYVKEYISSGQFDSDIEIVVQNAISFLGYEFMWHDGTDSWFFDIDETLVWGGLGTRASKEFLELLGADKSPKAIEPMLKLWKALLDKDYKIFLISERPEPLRNATVNELTAAGYYDWFRLYLRQENEMTKNLIQYKTEKREELDNFGYILRGALADQWNDMKGYPMALRSIKVPNPMYYME
ncbi:hypothetical protein LUZ60_012557 [Juncus effusus]|nr:hypothetical protein LUZ60_012557 [Juncus effusus]